MRKAIIDLGTNIFNLLIVEVEEKTFERIFHHKIGVGFGLGGINQHQIAPEAKERALNALRFFKEKCDEFQAEKIVAIGTSALRSATNKEAFIQQVYRELAIEIQLISGDQEAEWIYKGVKQTFDFSQKALIVDIGGGSIEFVLADNQGIIREMSLPIGISRMYQAIPTANPINEYDIQAIEQWTEEKVGALLDNFSCDTMVGASGSFETFYQMIEGHPFEKQAQSYRYDFQKLHAALDTLIYSKRPEETSYKDEVPIRLLMGPMTCVFIKWMFQKFGTKEVYVSPYSVKEGIIFE